MFDADNRMIICNDRYIEIYNLSREIVKPGCTLSEIIANRIATGSHDRDAEEYRAQLLNAMARGETISWVLETQDGRTIAVVNKPMPGGDWLGTHEDIAAHRRAQRELESTKSFLDTVIDNVPLMITVKDIPDFRYKLVNRAGDNYIWAGTRTGAWQNRGACFSEGGCRDHGGARSGTLNAGRETFYDVRLVTMSGRGPRIVTSKRKLLSDKDDKPQYLLTVTEDVTERKRSEAQIEFLAHHDLLTDLPNRAAFNACLEDTLGRAAGAGEKFAVLCIGLDRFKEINDVFGHVVGDKMLVEAGRRLQEAAAGAFIARMSGDEFAMIASDGEQPAGAATLAEQLLKCGNRDIAIEERVLHTGLSIGVAIFPNDGINAVTLLANADAALVRAKAESRGAVRFFEPDMDARLRDQRTLQHDLRSAIGREEIKLSYQP
jgi:diguanylate cyclase (GGDEF)-like protein